MTKDELNDLYFDWLCQLVINKRYPNDLSYRRLLSLLHNIEFYCVIGMDSNRAEDGIDLRYHFGDERGYEQSTVTYFLDDKPCSILEMLVALSLQCEKIMEEPNVENHVSRWFWEMIKNLKVYNMFDSHFDEEYVRKRIDIFLNREYEANGEGGLFVVDDTDYDLRDVEIWYQMCLYLNSIIKRER